MDFYIPWTLSAHSTSLGWWRSSIMLTSCSGGRLGNNVSVNENDEMRRMFSLSAPSAPGPPVYPVIQTVKCNHPCLCESASCLPLVQPLTREEKTRNWSCLLMLKPLPHLDAICLFMNYSHSQKRGESLQSTTPLLMTRQSETES